MVTWVKKCDAINAKSAILDIGCGNGLTLVNLVKYVGV